MFEDNQPENFAPEEALAEEPSKDEKETAEEPEISPVEVDPDFIKAFYGLIGEKVPANAGLEELKTLLEAIKSKLPAPEISFASGTDALLDSSRPKTVLVVDDLGIVTMQLSALLRKIGYEVVTSREIFDAIKKYKKMDFGYAILDLFIPTEREGFILIDEIKKLSLLCRLDTKIIVMSASNKKEHIEKCKSKGAQIFIEKTQGWQAKIINFIEGNLPPQA